MSEQNYRLMHKNDPVCSVSIDSIDGKILRVGDVLSPELLPLGGRADADALRKWWNRRAVPMTQGKMKWILQNYLNLSTPQEYLVNNLGLSISDHYWVQPIGTDLQWQDINFVTNDFHDIAGYIQMETPEPEEGAASPYAPSSSTQGNLQKQWVVDGKKRLLVKGNHQGNAQESLNEVLASEIHRKQGWDNFVTYHTVEMEQGVPLSCVCESFTSDKIEFIPAIDIVDAEKKDNATSLYEHFITVCTHFGLDEEQVRSFLEYQILTDFVMTDTDRHLNNFGILRDSDTLRFLGMAPIFDSGNSMFWDRPNLPVMNDLHDIKVSSFRQTEFQLLKLVRDFRRVDLQKLPTEEEVRAIYAADPNIGYVDNLLLGYHKKSDMLEMCIRENKFPFKDDWRSHR